MFKRIFGKNFEYWILLPTFVPNKINLIKMNYNSEINFANKTNFNIVRKDAYANKYGETIDNLLNLMIWLRGVNLGITLN